MAWHGVSRVSQTFTDLTYEWAAKSTGIYFLLVWNAQLDICRVMDNQDKYLKVILGLNDWWLAGGKGATSILCHHFICWLRYRGCCHRVVQYGILLCSKHRTNEQCLNAARKWLINAQYNLKRCTDENRALITILGRYVLYIAWMLVANRNAG